MIDLLEEYDFPIHEQIGELKTMMANEHDKMIMRVVQEVGIEIDRESLIEAIHNDRHRYEEAYKKGYSDCQKEYEEKMKRIANITGYRTCDEELNFD
jgi:hypothetical protein